MGHSGSEDASLVEPENATAAQNEGRLSKRIASCCNGPEPGHALQSLLREESAEEIALAIDEADAAQWESIFLALDERCAAQVLTLIDAERAPEIIAALPKDRFTRLLEGLEPRDAARVAAETSEERIEDICVALPSIAADAKARAAFPAGSAGRLMTNAFVRLDIGMSIAQALAVVRRTDPALDIPANAYVIEPIEEDGAKREALRGIISIRALAMADADVRVRDLMATEMVTIRGDEEDDAAANLLMEHKFASLPVLDRNGAFIGVIPREDLTAVLMARMRMRYARSVGGDAEAMEKATPLQAARMRVPWLLGTMVLELGAGVVIARFSPILEKFILLASFMPVISAVAGNVGLQAAAITVRALDTGQMTVKRRSAALFKEIWVTVLMGLVCALVLGTIGLIWSKGKFMFALVIAIALGCSMLTACVMGTLIPMASKKLGFDPATTAGPFETAFQDIVGFGVFLALATLLLR